MPLYDQAHSAEQGSETQPNHYHAEGEYQWYLMVTHSSPVAIHGDYIRPFLVASRIILCQIPPHAVGDQDPAAVKISLMEQENRKR